LGGDGRDKQCGVLTPPWNREELRRPFACRPNGGGGRGVKPGNHGVSEKVRGQDAKDRDEVGEPRRVNPKALGGVTKATRDPGCIPHPILLEEGGGRMGDRERIRRGSGEEEMRNGRKGGRKSSRRKRERKIKKKKGNREEARRMHKRRKKGVEAEIQKREMKHEKRRGQEGREEKGTRKGERERKRRKARRERM
jgi:hypothetical protein